MEQDLYSEPIIVGFLVERGHLQLDHLAWRQQSIFFRSIEYLLT
jgi:hypothetical protein